MIDAISFLAKKGIHGLDTKKRYDEVISWMEEYASLRTSNNVEAIGRNCPYCGEPCPECSHKSTQPPNQ